MRILNPENPYAEKFKEAVYKWLATWLALVAIMLVINLIRLYISVSSLAMISMIFALPSIIILLYFFAQMFFIGFYGTKYAENADHKAAAYLLLLFSFSPIIWVAMVAAKVLSFLKPIQKHEVKKIKPKQENSYITKNLIWILFAIIAIAIFATGLSQFLLEG